MLDRMQRAAIVKRHGITLDDPSIRRAAGKTLQVVISPVRDIGLDVGTSAVLSADAKGAPVRVIGNSTSRHNDLYWSTMRTDGR